jgi:hypothetical protein
MRCAGPCSIADRLTRNTGVAKAGMSRQHLTVKLKPPVACMIGEVPRFHYLCQAQLRPPRCTIIGEVSVLRL